MCLLNFTVEIIIKKKFLELDLYKGDSFHAFFFNKVCFNGSLESCEILCAVGKLE